MSKRAPVIVIACAVLFGAGACYESSGDRDAGTADHMAPPIADAGGVIDARPDTSSSYWDAGDADVTASDADAPLVLPCGAGVAPRSGDLPCVDAPCGLVSTATFEPGRRRAQSTARS